MILRSARDESKLLEAWKEVIEINHTLQGVCQWLGRVESMMDDFKDHNLNGKVGNVTSRVRLN